MPNPTCRRFTLADAMILVAATAVGVAVARAYYVARMGVVAEFWAPPISMYFGYATPLLISWSVALLVIRLRRPRPRPRRIFRQPGTVACCAVAFVVVARPVFMIADGVIGLISRDPNPFGLVNLHNFLYFFAGDGLGVAAAWMALAIAGCWKPEAEWIDRTGRALGACWIALWALIQIGL